MSKKRKEIVVECPHCQSEQKTKKGYVYCEVCGNGFPAKMFEKENVND